jgi:hypothetical protein
MCDSEFLGRMGAGCTPLVRVGQGGSAGGKVLAVRSHSKDRASNGYGRESPFWGGNAENRHRNRARRVTGCTADAVVKFCVVAQKKGESWDLI